MPKPKQLVLPGCERFMKPARRRARGAHRSAPSPFTLIEYKSDGEDVLEIELPDDAPDHELREIHRRIKDLVRAYFRGED